MADTGSQGRVNKARGEVYWGVMGPDASSIFGFSGSSVSQGSLAGSSGPFGSPGLLTWFKSAN